MKDTKTNQSDYQQPVTPPASTRKVSYSLLLWAMAAVMALGVVVAYNYFVFRSEMFVRNRGIPPVKAVPSFNLHDGTRSEATLDNFAEKIWLANFIFTRCSGPCPRVMAQMQALRKRLDKHPEVLFATFTVDPDHDDPDTMEAYRSRFAPDDPRWLFLTGPRKDMLDIIVKGFLLPVAPEAEENVPTEGLFLHSSRIVLVDQQGRIRQYYDGESRDDFHKLLEDIDYLSKNY